MEIFVKDSVSRLRTIYEVSMKSIKTKAVEYYEQESSVYADMYKPWYNKYPFNRIRLDFVMDILKAKGSKKILDVGCGSCRPMIEMLEKGFEVVGFDISDKMLEEGKKDLGMAGFDESLAFKADIEDVKSLPDEKFDAIIALGVFPHIINEDLALTNIKSLLNDGGIILIEFRNELFSAYTMNQYSADFYINKLIETENIPKDVLDDVVGFYSSRLQIDNPKTTDGKIHYSTVSAKFHNPLSIEKDVLVPNGFDLNNLHFYHYHALPPVFQKKYPKLFKELSLKMENTADPRGYLMASAYVVEATKK